MYETLTRRFRVIGIPRTLPAAEEEQKQETETPSGPHTLLRGTALLTARLAWLALVGLSLGVFVATTPARYVQAMGVASQNGPALFRLGLTFEALARYLVVLDYLTVLAFTVIALVIFWRKSNDSLALFISAVMIILATTVVRPADSVRLVEPMYRWPMLLMFIFGTSMVTVFLYIFPDGRFVPRWSKWLVRGLVLYSIAWYLIPALTEDPMPWPPGQVPLLLLLGFVGGVIAQIYRYMRVSSPVQRQQTRVIVFGFTAAIVGLLLFLVVAPALEPEFLQIGIKRVSYILVGVPIFYFSMVLLPLSIGISILRYRLWEIDVLINRTLVYVPLTAILAGLFAASITLTQKILFALTGETSDAATVVTTLLLVAAFTPIKNRLEALVDRRFKYPTRSFGAFGEELRKFVELNDSHLLTRRLLDETLATFNATGGAVFMGQGSHMRLVQSCGDWKGQAELAVPLESDGIRFGLIALSPKCSGSGYTQQDRESLQKIGNLVARTMAIQEHLHGDSH